MLLEYLTILKSSFVTYLHQGFQKVPFLGVKMPFKNDYSKTLRPFFCSLLSTPEYLV